MTKIDIIEDILIDNKLLYELLSNELYKSIVYSNTFKRLKNISFLGAIDYLTKNHKKFYRYEHSISVGTLALLYAKLKKFNQKDTDIIVVSALLHDIGHAPLSHSVENVFSKKYNLNHHQNGNNIIKGKSIFKNEIKNILNLYNIDENYIVKLLDGNIESELSFAFANPINIDTIDGINRCYLSINYRQRYQKLGLIPSPIDIVKALVKKDEKVLNEFWKLKDKIYNDFIHKPINLYADIFSSNFIHNEAINEEDFNLDDNRFKKNHNKLFHQLYTLKDKELSETLKYKKRTYIVNSNCLINDTDIYKKYTSFKNENKIFLAQNNTLKREQSLWQ